VALLAPNSARWLAADLAIMAEGALCVPLYARQAVRELAGMLADCTPVLLCGVEEGVLDAVCDAAGDASWLQTCQTMTFEELFAAGATGDRAPVAVAPHDPVTIIYTSGTSGEPKGVVYEVGNVDFMLPRTAGATQF
jgi:long-chain acyl-CoA synthetase